MSKMSAPKHKHTGICTWKQDDQSPNHAKEQIKKNDACAITYAQAQMHTKTQEKKWWNYTLKKQSTSTHAGDQAADGKQMRNYLGAMHKPILVQKSYISKSRGVYYNPNGNPSNWAFMSFCIW